MKNNAKTAALAAAFLTIAAAAAQAAEAQDNWTKNCAACHGPDGTGHTKAGRMAQVKDMTNPDYQKTFTDDQAAKQIKEGLKDKDGKEKMKSFGDVLSDSEVNDLVAFVRSLQKK